MSGLSQIRVLLADDDPNFRKVVLYNLERMGAEVTTAGDGREALALFAAGGFDIVLTDVKMPGMDGLALLREVRARDDAMPVILITAHGDIEMAVEAMQAGASDFLTKPFERERLAQKIERAARLPRLQRENRVLREQLGGRFTFDNIVGASPAMRELFEWMGRVAPRDATVLILGESGTGKELVARALHWAGPRRERPFVAINCAAIPPALLESELFGHVKGAFTGADRAREGRIRMAEGGTLLLDEIGDMPLDLQGKLLRVLQERQVEPVGAGAPTAVDVRVIAATNRELERLVRGGAFREDLYYRLNVVPLRVPPLRERREDIPLLVRRFLEQFGEPDVRVEPEAMAILEARDWPGNVRELENTIERALALRADPERIAPGDLEMRATAGGGTGADATTPGAIPVEIPDEGLVLDDVEKRLIQSALRKTGGNQTRAGRLLGITRQTLIYRMQKHGIES
jgi:two-component system NtrC family response regulator